MQTSVYIKFQMYPQPLSEKKLYKCAKYARGGVALANDFKTNNHMEGQDEYYFSGNTFIVFNIDNQNTVPQIMTFC